MATKNVKDLIRTNDFVWAPVFATVQNVRSKSCWQRVLLPPQDTG